jgi:hypothetical protein
MFLLVSRRLPQDSNSTVLLYWADFLNPGYDQYVYRHPNG